MNQLILINRSLKGKVLHLLQVAKDQLHFEVILITMKLKMPISVGLFLTLTHSLSSCRPFLSFGQRIFSYQFFSFV